MTSAEAPAPPDLRAVVLAAMAWAGGLAGFLLPRWLVAAAIVVGALLVLVHLRTGRRPVVLGAWLLAATAVAVSAMLRADAVGAGPVAALADERAFVTATVQVTSDPLPREGVHAPYVLVRATTLTVTGRGRTFDGRVPVLVIAGETWREVELGSVVRVEGRAGPSDGDDLAAVLSTIRPAEVLVEAGRLLDGAAAVRAGIRVAVSGAGEAERSLVPALVAGDDQGMPGDLRSDFQAAGLTHLLAVSGHKVL